MKAYNRELFCFGEKEHELNIWGCKKLNMPILWGNWLSHGQMDKDGAWTFDKERIRHDLELAIHEIELCPKLNRRQILETLEKLPTTVNPKIDKGWKYITDFQDTSDGGYLEVATGVRPFLRKAPGFVVGGFRPNWSSVTASREEAANTSSTTSRAQKTYKVTAPKSTCSCLLMSFFILIAISSFLASFIF